MPRTSHLVKGVLAALALLSCSRRSKSDASPPVGRPSGEVGITWAEPSALRRAARIDPRERVRYVVPRAPGDTEDGELVVFHFGAEELGGIESTLDRWIAQFSGVGPGAVTRANRQVNGVRLHTVEIERGTFEAGPPSSNDARRKDYALEGAIAEGPSSAYLFEMTGPARTIAGGRAAFAELLDSLLLVRPERH